MRSVRRLTPPRIPFIALVSTLLIGGVAQAADPLPPPRTAQLSLEKLELLQAETLLYEAQLTHDKALKELQAPQQEVAPPPPPAPGATLSAADIPAQADSLPRIREIAGNDRQLTAVLRLGDNTLVQVRAGQPIPGTDLTVKTLNAQGIQVVSGSGKDTQLHPLPFDN